MTARKLTINEIDYLFTFCAERGVYHYDLQIELVDHFATSIERQWETNHSLSLEDALISEYNVFNIFNFNQIIKEKEKSLTEKYYIQQIEYIEEQFKWPNIFRNGVLALFIFLVFFTIKSSLVVFYIYSMSYCLFLGFYRLILFPYKYKFHPETKKSFFIIDNQHHIKESMNMAVHFSILIIGSLFLFFSPELSFGMVILAKIVLALSFATSILFVVAAYKFVPQRIKADFIREYPQFIKA